MSIFSKHHSPEVIKLLLRVEETKEIMAQSGDYPYYGDRIFWSRKLILCPRCKRVDLIDSRGKFCKTPECREDRNREYQADWWRKNRSKYERRSYEPRRRK